MIFLSLIIPIYKVEEYIIDCLKSVCCQMIDGIEVILVNDGTPDKSMEMAKEYIYNNYNHCFGQFIFIDQENQGLSGARNTGIKSATGEYLAFLDSDDTLFDGYFNEILVVIEKYNPEIIQYKSKRFSSEDQIYFDFLKDVDLKGYYEINKEVISKVYNHSAWFVWLRVYHSKFFKRITFPQGRNYEDACVVPYIFFEAKSVFFLDLFLINYRVNPNSITATKSRKNIDDLKFAIDRMLNFLNREPLISASLISLSQHYVSESYTSEGFSIAYERWSKLKSEIKEKPEFNIDYVKNISNKFFYIFGIYFFIFLEFLVLIKVK
ncbi:glycosyltransferase [Acinetobacter ursingii]